jgi:hypothetical protein
MGIQASHDLHFWITRGMARRMGVNLARSVQDGALTQAGFAELIMACQGCGRGEMCLSLLSERGSSADVPPLNCPNKAKLEALRARY